MGDRGDQIGWFRRGIFKNSVIGHVVLGIGIPDQAPLSRLSRQALHQQTGKHKTKKHKTFIVHQN